MWAFLGYFFLGSVRVTIIFWIFCNLILISFLSQESKLKKKKSQVVVGFLFAVFIMITGFIVLLSENVVCAFYFLKFIEFSFVVQCSFMIS